MSKDDIANLPEMEFAGNVLDAYQSRLDKFRNPKSGKEEKIPEILKEKGELIFQMTVKVDLAWSSSAM